MLVFRKITVIKRKQINIFLFATTYIIALFDFTSLLWLVDLIHITYVLGLPHTVQASNFNDFCSSIKILLQIFPYDISKIPSVFEAS